MALRLEKSVLRKHQSERKSAKEFTILLVDDEKENLEALSLVLDKDYNLLFANDGVEALDIVRNPDRTEEIHMIISDQRMPRLTGVGLFQETSEILPDAVRIILTGFTDADAIISSINDGKIYKFLTKPIDPVDLRVTVRRSLEFYSLEQQNVQLVIDLRQRVNEVENLVRAFEKFVPRQFTDRVAAEGIQNVDNVEIGKAESATVTVLFADIRSFTSLSETMQPQEVLNFLNDCFETLSTPVHENRGFVDKYIGDAIMALFDSPGATDPEEANSAVQAAMSMQRALRAFNARRAKDGDAPIAVGIGIHTGPVIIGTVGVESRMDLTVLGDSVNLASRLESLNKVYGTSIIVSSHTMALLDPDEKILSRELDCLRVKGREEPLVIYEILCPNEGERAAVEEMLGLYSQALELYYGKDWPAARALFEQCLELVPGDLVSKLYKARCDAGEGSNGSGLESFRNKLIQQGLEMGGNGQG